MIDKTYEILLRKFQPDSPLLQVQDPEPVEVRKASITLKELMLQVRDEMLTSWGLDPTERHAWADQTVAGWVAVFKCKEYNVIDLPPEELR
jgi:hypothetical protein